MDEISEAIDLMVTVLEELQIPYFIAGSIASATYGEARTTRDVDIVVTIPPGRAVALGESLSTKFYVDTFAIERSVETGDCFNALTIEANFRVDVFTPSDTPWLQSQLERRVLRDLGTRAAFLQSPEDLVLSKLHWYRLGNEVSDRQWNDVIWVLIVQKPSLEVAYMQRWAAYLGISDLLNKALEEAGSVDA